MKRIIFTFFGLFLLAEMLMAGGIVTNTNQSAAWIRTLARDASVDVDAVFFNPAGLAHLEDGLYLQVNSQTVSQTRTITSSFPALNNSEYEGSTFVPFLPTAFAVYKTGNFAFSGGFTVIGGGGSSEFERGLPDFEYPVSTLPSALAGLKPVGDAAGVDLSVTGYSLNSYVKGTSAYYGFQGGVTYKINDMISVAAGARYVTAKNVYDGYIRDISLVTPTGTMRADNFINQKAIPTIAGINSQLTTAVTQLSAIPPLLEPFLTLFGGVTLDQALGAGAIDQATYDALIAAGSGIGLPNPGSLTLQQYYDGINTGIAGFNEQIAQLTATSAQLAGTANQLADKELQVEQTGSGFTPFFGIDLNLMEGALGLAVKYEMKTNMKVKTNVIKDDLGLYEHEEEVPNELPAMLSVGLRGNLGGLKLQTGYHYYFDDAAKYGRKNAAGDFVTNGEETTFAGSDDKALMAGNSYEFAVGAQYDINDLFGLSAGFLMTRSNPNSVYQTTLSHTLSTNTIGFGAVVRPTSQLEINLGVSMTSYDLYEKSFATTPSFNETYDRSAMVFAIGLGYKLL